ncbi:MAG: glycosyltransferase [Lachnospiraceae bacterium]|nr:glycosyltransferase [Lachnospiraceae bacterium]
MKKEVLFLISPMLHQGGFERVCVQTARLLAPYYDVRIVIFDDHDIAYDVTGLSLLNLNLGVRKSLPGKLLNVFRRSAALKKLKLKEMPVAAYSFGPTANYVNCLSKTKGTRVIAGLRSFTNVESPRQIRLFIKRSDLIISCSETIRNEMRERYNYARCVTLYNPFDLKGIREQADKENPGLPWDAQEKPFVIAASGWLAPLKGYWHMLKAFSVLHKSEERARLLILGDGDPCEYEKLAEELGIREQVFFAGMQKNPFAYLTRCDAFLMTSENEGFPNALVEGMALGLPAVSVDCESGPREILLSEREKKEVPKNLKEPYTASYGILCPPVTKGENFDPSVIEKEEEMIADALLKLMRDRELYKQLSEGARERAGELGSDKYLEKLLSLLEESERT